MTLVKFSSGNKPPVKGIIDVPMKLKDLIKVGREVMPPPPRDVNTRSFTVIGMFSDGMFSDGVFSDGTFSDWMFSDGTFSDGMFSDGVFSDGDF